MRGLRCRYLSVRIGVVHASDRERWESEELPPFARVLDLNVTKFVSESFLVSLEAVRGDRAEPVFENLHAGFFYPPYRDRFPAFDIAGPVRLRLTATNLTYCDLVFDAIIRYGVLAPHVEEPKLFSFVTEHVPRPEGDLP